MLFGILLNQPIGKLSSLLEFFAPLIIIRLLIVSLGQHCILQKIPVSSLPFMDLNAVVMVKSVLEDDLDQRSVKFNLATSFKIGIKSSVLFCFDCFRGNLINHALELRHVTESP